jgi:hypothetical protein
VLLLVGTTEGDFILESDEGRGSWWLRGPYSGTWPIHDVDIDRQTGAIYAGGGSAWHGGAVWRSGDFGETWQHSSAGLA